MSTKYTGGFITKSPVAPTTTAASGVWTLDQQQQYQKAGTWPQPPLFIEDMFSTYLYTGNGSTNNITNGIDLSGKGGLVWMKDRTTAYEHYLLDTARGNNSILHSQNTAAASTYSNGSFSVSSNGFTVTGSGSDSASLGGDNESTDQYVSWTFAKQPKFFDIVTYTGDGVAGRTVAHNLGAVPGCIIVKCVTQSENWYVYHQALGNTQTMVLNQTAAQGTDPSWNNTTPTSTVFTVGSNSQVNFSGRTYVAYLFASNAGGFPVSGGGSTNGITCGSVTIDGGGQATVNLGYEPQWILYKSSSNTQNWYIYDTMRGMPVGTSSGPYSQGLSPNTTAAEFNGAAFAITPTGFNIQTSIAGATYIYVAIRRGPMKPPTTGTSVFTPITYNGNGTSQTVTGSVGVPDLGFGLGRSGGAAGSNAWYDRLRGKELALRSTNATTEYSASPGGEGTMTNVMNGMRVENTYGILNDASTAYILYFMSRAPGFFDEVCYTGTGSNITLTHNLGAVPELMIFKTRTGTGRAWGVYSSAFGVNKKLILNTTAAVANDSFFVDTTPTASVFYPGNADESNEGGNTYVAYLFATVAGVSKVGSYTGTGALQTVNCGFAAGARFVLIKRTDSTGDWYTYDSARGLTSGNDPYLLLNAAAAEVTGTNYVDTDTTGFQVTAAAPAGLNANGGTYIFLAIA